MDNDYYLFDYIDFEKCLFSLYEKKEIIFNNKFQLDLFIVYLDKKKQLVATLYLKKGKLVNIIFSQEFKKNNDLLDQELYPNLQKIVDAMIEGVEYYFLDIVINKIKDKIKAIESGEFLYESDANPKKLEYIKQLFLIFFDYKCFKQLDKFLLLSKSNLDINSLINESEINFIEFFKCNEEYLKEFINIVIYCYVNCCNLSNQRQLKLVYDNLNANLKYYFVSIFLEKFIKCNKSFALINDIVDDFKSIVNYNGLNILKTLTNYSINLDDEITIGNIYKELFDIKITIDGVVFSAQDLFIYNLFQDRLLLRYNISNIFKIIRYTNIKKQEHFLKIISNFNTINNKNTEKFINDFLKNLSVYYVENPNMESKKFITDICKYFFSNGIFLEYKISNQKIRAKDFLVYNIIDNIFETRNFIIDIFKLLDNIVLNEEELENIIINSLFIHNYYDILHNFIIYLLENNSIRSKNFIKNIYNKIDNLFFNFYGNNQVKVSHYLVNIMLNFAVMNREENISNLLYNIINQEIFIDIINFNKNNDILCLSNSEQLCIFENLTRLYNTKENNDFIKYVIKKIDDFEILEKFKVFTEKGKFFYNMINYRLEELKEIEKLKEIIFIDESINFINFKYLYDKESDNFLIDFFDIINKCHIQKNEYNYFYDAIISLEKGISNSDIFLEKFKYNEDFSIFYINKKLEKENIFIKQEDNHYFIVNKVDDVVVKIENGNKNIVDYIIFEHGINYLETEMLKLINEKTGIKQAVIKNYEKHKIFDF